MAPLNPNDRTSETTHSHSFTTNQIWLRDEAVPTERRTSLTPRCVHILVQHGFQVCVERSAHRPFADEEYSDAGAVLVDANTWQTSAPLDALILGLQGFSNVNPSPIAGNHACFAYAYRRQAGWRELLGRFQRGGGSLYDLESLEDFSGRRIATFGKVAGSIAAGLALLTWCQQQLDVTSPIITTTSPTEMEDADESSEVMPLLSLIAAKLTPACTQAGRQPRVLVIGCNGRAGSAAAEFTRKFGISVTGWTRIDVEKRFAELSDAHTPVSERESAVAYGLSEALSFDIVINAVKRREEERSVFLSLPLLHSDQQRKLSVVLDVTCDTHNANNALPINDQRTTFENPVRRVLQPEVSECDQVITPPVDLIAIPVLASLLPRESSEYFSAQLLPHLLCLHPSASLSSPVWSTARAAFDTITHQLGTVHDREAVRLPTDYVASSPKAMSSGNVLRVSLPSDPTRKNVVKTLGGQLPGLLVAAASLLAHRVTHLESLTVGVLHSEGERGASAETRQTSPVSSFHEVETLFTEKQTFTALVDSVSLQLACARRGECSSSLSAQQPVDDLIQRMKDIDPVDLPRVMIAISANNTLPSSFDPLLCSPHLFTAAAVLIGVDRDELFISVHDALFSRHRALEMLSQVECLLRQVADSPSSVLCCELSLVTQSARDVLPDPTKPLTPVGALTAEACELDLSADDFSLDQLSTCTIQDVFCFRARQHPARPAVVHNGLTLTYGDLDALTARLANFLVCSGIQPGDVVAIFGFRNICIVQAVMGVLRAGAVFTLVDPAYPDSRLKQMIDVAHPSGWINIAQAGTLSADVQGFLVSSGCCVQVTITPPVPGFTDVTDVLASQPTTSPRVPRSPDDTAVLTFTSGSTGRPKGVYGRHASLTRFYPWMSRQFGLTDRDVYSLCSGIAHDPLQRDIFTPLFFGAQIHIPDAADIANPGHLLSWFRAHRITVSCLTPAMGQLLCETTDEVVLSALHTVFFVGDKLTKRDVRRLRHCAPLVRVVNMYGSTETQRAVSFYTVPASSNLDRLPEILSVGTGMGDDLVQLIVVNSCGQLAGVGELGEVFVRSHFISKGYKDLPDVTRERFLPSVSVLSGGNTPLPETTAPVLSGDRMYRTGDLGRYTPTGGVDIAGRVDDQVKIRGFRIELGEINTQLAQHHAVRENVVLVREDVPGQKRLVAYVLPADSTDKAGGSAPAHVCASEIRTFLQGRLPSYMIPSAFVTLTALPLTPNGKIARNQLPAPERVRNAQHSSLDTHTSRLPLSEHLMDGLWRQIFPNSSSSRRRAASPPSPSRSPSSGVATNPRAPATTATSIASVIEEVWCEVLGHSQFNHDDDFFEIGGHSLSATRCVLLLRSRLLSVSVSVSEVSAPSREIPVQLLMSNRTVSRLTQALEGLLNASQVSSTPLSDSSQRSHTSICVSDLSSDIALPASVRVSEAINGVVSTPRAVFLTGATGFLGGVILQHILAHTDLRVYCLVRASDASAALDRLRSGLVNTGVWQERYQERLVVALGDLAEPQLGMSTSDWTRVYAETDLIIHSGAKVHWLEDYHSLRAPNVLGTAEVLRLATLHHVKPVHHVSTTSVFDSPRDNSLASVINEEEDIGMESALLLSQGYAQSKWVAERLVLLARSRGVPAYIHRPGYISGHSKTGTWTTDDFLCRFVKGCVQLGCAPELGEAVFDMMPVDAVAENITTLAIRAQAHITALPSGCIVGTNYNHVNRVHPFRAMGFVNALNSFGFPLRPVPYNLWRESLFSSVGVEENALHPVMSVFDESYVSSRQQPPVYSTTNLERDMSLGGRQFNFPDLVSLMPTYLTYLVRARFLPMPANVPSAKKALLSAHPVHVVTRTNRT